MQAWGRQAQRAAGQEGGRQALGRGGSLAQELYCGCVHTGGALEGSFFLQGPSGGDQVWTSLRWLARHRPRRVLPHLHVTSLSALSPSPWQGTRLLLACATP